MPFAQSNGARIHYTVTGDGPPLVLLCGFPQSLDDWHELGYVEALADAYRVIAIDPLGQGRSDRPHDPTAYAPARRVGDVLAVLDAEGIDRAHFWGYSRGARTGYLLGRDAADRFHSLVLGAMSPDADDPARLEETATVFRSGMERYVETIERTVGRLRENYRARLLASDGEALAASTLANRDIPSLDAALPGVGLPALVYCGDRDPYYAGAERAARLLPHATFVPLPGLDHVSTFRAVDRLAALVRDFLARVPTSVP